MCGSGSVRSIRDRIAWNGTVEVRRDGERGTSRYSLYGIEANYRNGRARLFAVDRGSDSLVMATQFFESSAG